MRILTGQQVDDVLQHFSIDEYLGLSRDALSAFSTKECACPARIVIENDRFTSLHMPSQMAGVTAEKVVCVPQEGSAGLPAFITILDRDTGRLQCILNAAQLTAVRTASASLLSTKIITGENPDWRPKSLWIFGSGEQAYHHARLHLLGLTSLNRVRIVARKETPRLLELVAKLRREFGSVETTASYSPVGNTDIKEDVRDADIICCCTPSKAPLFTYDEFRDVSKRQHIVLIGSYKPTMTEVDEETFGSASDIFVDSKADCLKEAGDLMAAIGCGKINDQDLLELGTVLGRADHPTERRESFQLSIYKSVGMSVMDNSVARAVHEKAVELSLGSLIQDF